MVKSQQERFNNTADTAEQFFFTTSNLISDYEEAEPAYQADARTRDAWLLEFVKREPHLAGVVSSVTAIDKNRGWRVIGGRNQVKRVTDMLHNFEVAPGLKGWRPALASASEAFWNTDLGAVVELGKESRNGPIKALYNVDPTMCRLTGRADYPLYYYPKSGKLMKWADNDYFRVVSLPSIIEKYNALGNCAVSRCVQIAQLMIALYRHEEEKMLSRAPRGLLLLSGIKRDQWEKAMQARDAQLDAKEVKYFGAVAVLASAASTVEAKLVALSELPANFELRTWMDMTMYGYALCFGYDQSEFWPVQYGALGRGNETKIQHEKATGKGRLDFVLGFQEQLQNFLPDSIDFEFDQRDEQGDLIHASVHQAWSDVAETLYSKSQANNVPLLSREETRVILADYGIIPSAWADSKYISSTDSTEVALDMDEIEGDSEATGTDGKEPQATDGAEETSDVSASPMANLRSSFETRQMKRWKEKLKDLDTVKRAVEKYPYDEIVQYSYPGHSVITLWDRGEDVYKKQIFTKGESMTEKKKDIAPLPLPDVYSGGRQIVVNIPDTKLPDIRVEQPAPIVNFNPEIHMPDIVFPEQRAPIVNITTPEQRPPVVQVNIPQQPAPVVNVKAPIQQQSEPNITFSPNIIVEPTPVEITNEITIPENQEEIEVFRDSDGKISKMIKKFLRRR